MSMGRAHHWPLAGLALTLTLTLSLTIAMPVRAASALPPIDPRVQVIEYAPDMIVPLATTPGFAVTIDFGDDEKVETVSIGDSTDWQISPNHRANLLFVKPMTAPAATNMTVVTNQRVYYFALTASMQRRGAMPAGQVFALHWHQRRAGQARHIFCPGTGCSGATLPWSAGGG